MGGDGGTRSRKGLQNIRGVQSYMYLYQNLVSDYRVTHQVVPWFFFDIKTKVVV